jgi:chemosensory pili system protein ChpA (sensor histidine kinase/response regulator)
MTDISSQTLHVVAKELATTLGEARVALEAYAERIDQREMLEKCAEQLHLAHGVLRLVEVYGAALLAEEMEQVTRYLLDSGVDEKRADDKRQTDGLDALMRAMVQLPTYLERVLSGGRDLALVLLPLLNDLRSVRGSPLLSEGTLLLLNLKSDQSAQPQASPQSPAIVAQWARRLRPRFQVGLLGFIRGERPAQNLEILAKVAEKLEQVASTQPVFQFWWVTGAILEALRANGLEASLTLKRLLGQADRQIKALYEIGEVRYSEHPPIDLLNNLLYYVARASTEGGRIAAVRASFKLSELLPLDDTIEQERESLSAPSVKLMRTVAAAIKEDLAKVKDVLDIFVRRGEGQIADLAAQLELLKKISDTLGVLGLGELRQRVQQEINDLTSMLGSDGAPPEDALLKVAGVLLSVEDSLDDQLLRLILPTPDREFAPAADDASEHEFRQVSEAVLRECIVNLARIKEAISTAVQKPGDFSPQGLDNVPQLLRGITAGLLMLGKGRAVELMDAIGVHVRKLVEPGAPAPGAQRLERVADAIVSIEYYMETIQNGRNDPWYMLDNAEICIKALDEDLPEPLTRLVMPTADPSATLKIDYQATMKLDPMPTAHLLQSRSDAAAPPLAPPRDAPPPAALTNKDAGLDPALLELFIEEAKEEMASISSNFPLWEQNPMEIDALFKLRRSFHTLKGSGRMVGARLIGEFAWSIENLVNRIIDKTSSRTPAMIGVMRAAVAALPHLIEQLETGRISPVPLEEIMARAYALADSRQFDQTHTPLAPEERAPTAASADAPLIVTPTKPAAMDPVLHDIYSKETANHLAEIRNYLHKRAGQLPPHDLPESVYRAIHTLSGSSKMAEARHGIRITEPLNHYMRKVFDAGRGLTDQDLVLLEDAVAAIDNVVSHIDESTIFFADQPQLLERIRSLEIELDAVLARAAAAADRSQLTPVLEDPSEASAAPAALAATAEPAAAVEPEPAVEPAVPEQAAEPAAPAEPVVVAEPFDLEIANIFSEEATELLEAAQASLNAWNGDRKSQEPAAELQRQLHTLKGGARMAGISAMGDLSHELETLVIQIDSGAVPASDRAHAVLQSSIDELARMRDTVSAGALPSAAANQIQQIRALTSGQTPPKADSVAPSVAASSVAASSVAAPNVVAANAGAPGATAPTPPSLTAPPIPAGPDSTAFAAAAQKGQEPALSLTGEFSSANIDLTAAPVLPGRESAPVERTEMARVDAELLDTMLNNAGEVSIFRARLGQQVNSIDFNLAELARTVTRLKEQLRGMEIETEAQVLHGHRDEDASRGDFDPLELDRYSSLQQFSRALAETSSDVASIQGLLETLTREAQNLLTQQARVITDLQNSLMRTRMVPFQRHVQRLTRLVRQAANDTGKRAELSVDGASAELDRQVLERMVPPLEHMLRNAVVHGIESPERRASLGKPELGRIHVSLARDGAEVVIVVTDDGAGINTRLIREKAQSLGLADPDAKLTDEEAMQLILEPGFSTAGRVTQAAGRGVGMDVVATEVKKLGGGLFIESTLGTGSRFTIRLPFTLAISQALIVRVAEEVYALPMPTVEGVVRLPRNIVARHLGKEAPLFEYGGQKYRFQHLGSFVGLGATRLPETDVSMSVVLIRAGEHSTALVTDELVGSREIVVKNLGPQISAIRGIAGATILGDGRIVVILDMGSLVRSEWRGRPAEVAVLEQRDRRTFALVVDDSITVRRVTQRLLERNGMRVLTAKDGVEAVSLLQENLPDIILLDIEMPRMDGYEVASHVRNDQRLKHIPIVMITSRVSEKHRARAIELGVDDYLGKPYQESQLLDAIEPLVNRRSAVAR